MTFLLDVSDSRELNQQFEAYQSYLRSVEGKLETNAFAFASALWHYDAQDPRCPHDAWVESIKVGTDVIGNRTKVKVVKNKVAPPFKVAEFDILFAEGISKEGGLLDVGVAMGIIRKSGAFFSFGDTRLGQGRENARDFLRENAPIALEIDGQIRNNSTRYQVMEVDSVGAAAE